MVAALSFISIAYLFIDLSSSTIEKNRVTCCVTHKRTGIFCQGVWWTICPKISFKLPKFLWNSWKETRVIRCTDNGLHMKWKYSYIWIYHMSSKNTLKLKRNRVVKCPFNVNKCNAADMLLPHSTVELSFQSAHYTEWLLCWTRCSRYHCKDMHHLRKIWKYSSLSLAFLKQLFSLICARDKNSRTFSARLRESCRWCCKT